MHMHIQRDRDMELLGVTLLIGNDVGQKILNEQYFLVRKIGSWKGSDRSQPIVITSRRGGIR